MCYSACTCTLYGAGFVQLVKWICSGLKGLRFEGIKNCAEWLDDSEGWIEREVRGNAQVLVHSTLCNLREVADQTAETLVRMDAVSGHIPTENFPINWLALGIETRWGLLQGTGSELGLNSWLWQDSYIRDLKQKLYQLHLRIHSRTLIADTVGNTEILLIVKKWKINHASFWIVDLSDWKVMKLWRVALLELRQTGFVASTL